MAPDAITYPLKSESRLSKRDVKDVLKKKFEVLCIGNGLGDDPESLESAMSIISKSRKPVVVDGDGLKAIKPILSKLGKRVVLTPHGGEFKQLFGLLPNERNLKKVSKKYKCLVLLKGKTDLIAQGSRLKYNESGNPYMSKGGTGDVLAGLCAGFLAQGLDAFHSACFAALVNGVAGDLAYSEQSIGLTASDVLSSVGLAEKVLLE
jgi:NAD(P)H-hydrate epimerase